MGFSSHSTKPYNSAYTIVEHVEYLAPVDRKTLKVLSINLIHNLHVRRYGLRSGCHKCLSSIFLSFTSTNAEGALKNRITTESMFLLSIFDVRLNCA